MEQRFLLSGGREKRPAPETGAPLPEAKRQQVRTPRRRASVPGATPLEDAYWRACLAGERETMGDLVRLYARQLGITEELVLVEVDSLCDAVSEYLRAHPELVTGRYPSALPVEIQLMLIEYINALPRIPQRVFLRGYGLMDLDEAVARLLLLSLIGSRRTVLNFALAPESGASGGSLPAALQAVFDPARQDCYYLFRALVEGNDRSAESLTRAYLPSVDRAEAQGAVLLPLGGGDSELFVPLSGRSAVALLSRHLSRIDDLSPSALDITVEGQENLADRLRPLGVRRDEAVRLLSRGKRSLEEDILNNYRIQELVLRSLEEVRPVRWCSPERTESELSGR